MRRRLALGLVVGLTLAAAGCLGALSPGEEPDPADANRTDPGNAEAREAGEAPPANDTGSTGGNGTAGTDEARDGGHAFGNLTMEGAARERPNASAIVFTWSGEAGASGTNASFEVPASAPFAVDATLAWEAEAGLHLTLAAPEADGLCSVGATAFYETDAAAGPVTCEVPSLAQPENTTWTAAVERADAESALGLDRSSVAFTLTLEIRALPAAVAEAGPSRIGEADPAPGQVGWPAPGDAAVRPGVSIAGGCTGNFVFATPGNGTLYMGTAAHCIDAPSGQPPVHLGDAVPVADGAYTGRVAYCSWGAVEDLLMCPGKSYSDADRDDDFALIELPPEARDDVNPALRVWGGPTGVAAPPDPDTRVQMYGNSNLRDAGQDANVGDSRAGVVRNASDTRTYAYFAPPSVPGDSGSPVITADGPALGTLAAGTTGRSAIVNLQASLANLEAHTGRAVELATWPLFDPPRYEPVPSPSPP